MTRYLALIACLCLLPFSAQAQQTPTFTIVDLGPMNLRGDEMSDPVQALEAVGNSEMKTVLQLQNQITMINALTNWETQISKMRETYAQAGLPFTSPKPPRNICEQVPPNTVCGDAYPEFMPETVMPPLATSLASVSATMPSTANPASAAKSVAPPQAVASYEWADIQCYGSDCKAVLIDLASGARITVLPGEMIDDNVMVQNISSNGVTLTVKGKAEKIKPSRPVSKDGGDDTTIANPQSVTEALKDMPASPAPVDPVVLDDGSGNENSAQPGATGLF